MKRLLSKYERGQTIVLIGLSIVALLGAIALGTDVAVMYYNWSMMQKAADAAALAGANYLPEDPLTAANTAKTFGNNNGITNSEMTHVTCIDPANGSYQCSDTAHQPANFQPSKVQIDATRTVGYIFAKVLGLNSQVISVSATAAAPAPISSYDCMNSTGSTCSSSVPNCPDCTNGTYGSTTGQYELLPFGLQYTTTFAPCTSTPCSTIHLTQGGTGNNGSYGPGNWGLLALGASGGAVTRANIANGYNDPLNVTDWVNTEPGVKTGPVDQGVQDRISAAPAGQNFDDHSFTNPQVVILPLVDWNHPDGRSGVQIKGFAMFWLAGSSGGNVTGYFITQVAPNSVANTKLGDYGARGAPILIK